MSSTHSEYAGTEHRGTIITQLHGLPVQFTPCQEAMNLPPASPDWHDSREHIDGTMKTKPDARHVVYAGGERVKSFPMAVAFNEDGGRIDYGLLAANQLASTLRKRCASHSEAAEVTIDAWLSEANTTDAYTTRPDDGLTQSVYAEALEASMAS